MDELRKLMAGLQAEIKSTFEAMKGENERFKAEHRRELEEAKKNSGRPDPLTDEKINKHAEAIAKLEEKMQGLSASLSEAQAAAQRLGPGASEADDKRKEMAERKEFSAKFIRPKGSRAMACSPEFVNELSTDSGEDGGYLTVPASVTNGILSRETLRSPMRQLCTVQTVTNEEFEQLVDTGGTGFGWVAERESRSETDTPALAGVRPFWGEIYAEPAITQKMLDDSAYDVAGWLEGAVAMKFGMAENIAYTTGSGIKKPKGILAYSLAYTADSASRPFQTIEKIKSASAGAFAIDPLIDVVHALDPMYQTGAVWQMPTLALAKVRKLKSGDNYVYQPSMMSGEPSQILGYPVYINNDMETPAADSKSAMFGNFQMAYSIFDRKGITILRDPFTSKGKVLFYTTKRVGGGLMEDRAVKVHVLSA